MSAPHSPARQRRDASRGGGATKQDGTAFRILVIESDDAVARRSAAALEAAGFEVAVADLPDIGIVRRVAPDAIVLSLVFRGQASGLAFLERHVADPAAAATPVIVHGSGERLDADQMGRLRAVACPARPNALLEQVAACLRSSSRNAGAPENPQPAASSSRQPEPAAWAGIGSPPGVRGRRGPAPLAAPRVRRLAGPRPVHAPLGAERTHQADRLDVWEWEGGALEETARIA